MTLGLRTAEEFWRYLYMEGLDPSTVCIRNVPGRTGDYVVTGELPAVFDHSGMD